MFETIPFLEKKRGDPMSPVLSWGSAEIETGLKALAPCIGGGCLCYVCDVLDLFKENGEGGGNVWCIFMNLMTPVCSQKTLPKK